MICKYCKKPMECVGTERTGYRNKNHFNGNGNSNVDLIGWFTCNCPAFKKNGDSIDKFAQNTRNPGKTI